MYSYSNRAYIHGYCNTFVYIHNFASIDVDFLQLKCVKLTTFCILHNFAVALKSKKIELYFFGSKPSGIVFTMGKWEILVSLRFG